MSSTTTTEVSTMQAQTQPASSAADGEISEPPPLSYRIVTSDDEKRDALRLVADSIAQQRQVAALAIIYHPLCVAILVAICSVTYRFYQHQGYGTLMTMFSGVFISYLAAIRWYTSGYIQQAEDFRWKTWLTGEDEVEDLVITAVFGDELIGALILRLQGSEEDVETDIASSKYGIIRAWTTKRRYRGQGVGSDLLRFAVQVAKDTFGADAKLRFAGEHANSARLPINMFNGPLEKREANAVQALKAAMEGRTDR